MTLKLGYQFGAINANSWFFVHGPQAPFIYTVEHILHPSGPYKLGWFFTGIGSIFTFSLLFMRYRFLWWPFHPLGFVFCGSSLTAWIWFSIFIGWLLKTLLLKYGGAKVYSNARPFFLGLILGQFTASGIWLIIDFFTKTTGNMIFSI